MAFFGPGFEEHMGNAFRKAFAKTLRTSLESLSKPLKP
jgi:hypothetical protein